MKENEEKKDGKPIEGEGVSKTGMDFGQTRMVTAVSHRSRWWREGQTCN